MYYIDKLNLELENLDNQHLPHDEWVVMTYATTSLVRNELLEEMAHGTSSYRQETSWEAQKDVLDARYFSALDMLHAVGI